RLPGEPSVGAAGQSRLVSWWHDGNRLTRHEIPGRASRWRLCVRRFFRWDTGQHWLRVVPPAVNRVRHRDQRRLLNPQRRVDSTQGSLLLAAPAKEVGFRQQPIGGCLYQDLKRVGFVYQDLKRVGFVGTKE